MGAVWRVRLACYQTSYLFRCSIGLSSEVVIRLPCLGVLHDMIDSQSQDELKVEMTRSIEADRDLLDQLRREIRPLQNLVRRIQPRTITSISLVATDGGNNRFQFDPFLVQIVRVVDSSNNQLCLEAITPTTKTAYLSQKQF